MKILGLDASTTTIGVCLLEIENNIPKILNLEYYKPPKKGNIFERLTAVRIFIQDKLKLWNPDEVVLEDIILFFPGKSNAKTITSLAVLNRTVGLAVYDYLNKAPILYSVMKIRHAIKNKAISNKPPKKEDVPDRVAEILNIKFPYEYNKKGKLKEENYDMADSVAVALTHWKLSQPKLVKTVKKLKSKKV